MYSEVKRIIKHPHNNNRTNDYDFALVSPKEKMIYSDTIDYIELPTDDDTIRTGSICWTAGWGNESVTYLLTNIIDN